MGKFYKFAYHCVGLLCASAFAVQALAVESTARVSTSIDAASGYRGVNSSTLRTPAGVNIRPLPSVQPPNVSKMASGGLQQAMRGTVAANDGRFSTVLNMRVRASNATLKGGAKSLLKGGLAGVALTIGLDAFLDGLDWVIGEGGQVVRSLPVPLTDIPPGAISTGASRGCSGCFVIDEGERLGQPWAWYCSPTYGVDGPPFIGYQSQGRITASCYYMPNAKPDDGFSNLPLSEAAIDDAVDNYYEPEPEDWPLLSPRIQPDDIEIYDLPGTIYGEPETVTVSDPAGNPLSVTVTEPAYNLEPRENPSPQPALDLNIDVETRTYNEHGELTGISTATSTAPAGAGGGGEPPEIPTDCAFMPTICAFLEWFQEPDSELDTEPDFSAIRDDIEPGDGDYQVGASTAACPPPIQISFAMFPSTEVSLQPLCDFVDLLRPLVLMLAFFFSATIVLRS